MIITSYVSNNLAVQFNRNMYTYFLFIPGGLAQNMLVIVCAMFPARYWGRKCKNQLNGKSMIPNDKSGALGYLNYQSVMLEELMWQYQHNAIPVERDSMYLPAGFVPPGDVPVFLLRRLLKKLARTPSLVPVPGLPGSN